MWSASAAEGTSFAKTFAVPAFGCVAVRLVTRAGLKRKEDVKWEGVEIYISRKPLESERVWEGWRIFM